MNIYDVPRKSFMSPGNIYFWTSTINSWFKLLADDDVKEIIISSLYFLSEKNKIKVYAFVIMPNHIHSEPYKSLIKALSEPYPSLMVAL